MTLGEVGFRGDAAFSQVAAVGCFLTQLSYAPLCESIGIEDANLCQFWPMPAWRSLPAKTLFGPLDPRILLPGA